MLFNDESPLPLESVITTSALEQRGSRAPDFASENGALLSLMADMSNSPGTILQSLAETALKVCLADSAGISLLEEEQGRPHFRWHAVAGRWARYVGGTMPREMSPCGVVIDRDVSLLLDRPERHFPIPGTLVPTIFEVLLVPFHSEGKPVGTVWIVAHDAGRQFDSEDERMMKSLAGFASVAHHTIRAVDRERAQMEALRESEQRLRFVMDWMPQKVFTADATGAVTYFNPQWSEFTGLTFEQIKGWGWSQFIHPDDLQENLRVWKQAIETGQSLLFDHRFRRADGVYRWHSSRVAPVRDADGNIIMWIGSNTDIDDVMRTREALEEASRRKDAFLATVSHELRTPMTSILGWTSLMATCTLSTETQTEGIASIHRSALAQANLIDDILDVARVTAGKLNLSIEPLDLDILVRAAIAVVGPSADAKQIRIDMAFEPDLPGINGDSTRLQQVVWNLLSNAVKFTQPGGTVAVRLVSENGLVHLIVRDTGIGIHPDFLPYAFDRFAQQDNGSARRYGGLGIGLAVVKHLVELHGGTVSAASEGEGLGSTFTVSLPARERRGDRVAAGAGGAYASPVPSIAGLRVLLVDDSGDSRKAIAAMLKQFGAKVTEASDAVEAFTLFGTEQFDVLVCDLAMPNEDGYSLVRRIRAKESTAPGIPAVALTAFGGPSEKKRALEHGFSDYLQKPVEPDELIRHMAAARPA